MKNNYASWSLVAVTMPTMFILGTLFTGGYLVFMLDLLYISIPLGVLSITSLILGILGISSYKKNNSIGGKKSSWFSTIAGVLIIIISMIMLFSNFVL